MPTWPKVKLLSAVIFTKLYFFLFICTIYWCNVASLIDPTGYKLLRSGFCNKVLTTTRDPKSNLALSSSWGDEPSSAQPVLTLICSFCLIACNKKYSYCNKMPSTYLIKRKYQLLTWGKITRLLSFLMAKNKSNHVQVTLWYSKVGMTKLKSRISFKFFSLLPL